MTSLIVDVALYSGSGSHLLQPVNARVSKTLAVQTERSRIIDAASLLQIFSNGCELFQCGFEAANPTARRMLIE
jgi:hypothetical protein